MNEMTEPLLRSLGPMLTNLSVELRSWMDGRQAMPLGIVLKSTAEGLCQDLSRRAETLKLERPILTVMLMGGTGVGKSTLLNALAGAPIANASFTRPTTREPVVYYHHSLQSENLEAPLRHCRLVAHEREKLLEKVLVDTPDLDSNDQANRDRLMGVLPVADIVLYVGSQEKYHDKLGWDLFKQQRERSAFAFVLNKWDRCLHNVAGGMRPDDDLIRDLKQEGFENPVLFRTVASYWAENPVARTPPAEGEQFLELLLWLESGLNKLEIEAIKARGIGQLLAQVEKLLGEARPPDWSETAAKVQAAWQSAFAEEGAQAADQLMQTLDRHHLEIEHHFRVEGQQRFRGLMAAWLGLTTKFRTLGGSLRDQLPLPGRILRGKEGEAEPPNLSHFIQSCISATGDRLLEKRMEALANRLLVLADEKGIQPAQINAQIDETRRAQGAHLYEKSLFTAWQDMDAERSKPSGIKGLLQRGMIALANFLPAAVLIGGYLLILWDVCVNGVMPTSLFQLLLPAALAFIVILLLQLMIQLLLPFNWSAVRDRFRDTIALRLAADLGLAFNDIPTDVAKRVLLERQKTDAVLKNASAVSQWLTARENAVAVQELYGKR